MDDFKYLKKDTTFNERIHPFTKSCEFSKENLTPVISLYAFNLLLKN